MSVDADPHVDFEILMTAADAYGTDLAYVHDQGFGKFARESAPGLLRLFEEAGIRDGRVVDLGCGSGIWAGELVKAGYEVTGVDISPAMLELARRQVPQAEFHCGSFLQFRLPQCRAITALGEVFNYLFDENNSLAALRTACTNAFDALLPGGLLVFDVAEPGRRRGFKQAFAEGPDWTCLVKYRHDEAQGRLERRIVTFRKIGDLYRRSEELHRQQLFDAASIEHLLEQTGFRVQIVRSYGAFPLDESVAGFVAAKV